MRRYLSCCPVRRRSLGLEFSFSAIPHCWFLVRPGPYPRSLIYPWSRHSSSILRLSTIPCPWILVRPCTPLTPRSSSNLHSWFLPSICYPRSIVFDPHPRFFFIVLPWSVIPLPRLCILRVESTYLVQVPPSICLGTVYLCISLTPQFLILLRLSFPFNASLSIASITIPIYVVFSLSPTQTTEERGWLRYAMRGSVSLIRGGLAERPGQARTDSLTPRVGGEGLQSVGERGNWSCLPNPSVKDNVWILGLEWSY